MNERRWWAAAHWQRYLYSAQCVIGSFTNTITTRIVYIYIRTGYNNAFSYSRRFHSHPSLPSLALSHSLSANHIIDRNLIESHASLLRRYRLFHYTFILYIISLYSSKSIFMCACVCIKNRRGVYTAATPADVCPVVSFDARLMWKSLKLKEKNHGRVCERDRETERKIKHRWKEEEKKNTTPFE